MWTSWSSRCVCKREREGGMEGERREEHRVRGKEKGREREIHIPSNETIYSKFYIPLLTNKGDFSGDRGEVLHPTQRSGLEKSLSLKN